MLSRRTFVQLGGGLAASLVLPRPAFAAPRVVDITMSGREDGSRVWFEPQGLQIMPGDTVRWTNNDPVNSHTATAYHPSLYDRPLRIPQRAEPWDSDYLLPGESFSVTFRVPGVYDYYCVPHEAAGMVGRLIVGNARRSAWMDAPGADDGIPEAALEGFPDINSILASGSVSTKG